MPTTHMIPGNAYLNLSPLHDGLKLQQQLLFYQGGSFHPVAFSPHFFWQGMCHACGKYRENYKSKWNKGSRVGSHKGQVGGQAQARYFSCTAASGLLENDNYLKSQLIRIQIWIGCITVGVD